jgi:hypothetical protein
MTTAIFSDESKNDDAFLVAALRAEVDVADRMVRRIRKAAGITGPELHGLEMTDEQRRIAFDFLIRSEAVAIAVVARSDDPVGAFLMRQRPEPPVWQAMLIEAVMPLVTPEVRAVVPDGGAYKRAALARVAADVQAVFSRRGHPVEVHMADSRVTPGVQLVDVVANTVLRATTRENPLCVELVAKLGATGRLSILPARAQHLVPDWVRMEAEMRKAALADGLSMEHGASPVVPPE